MRASHWRGTTLRCINDTNHWRGSTAISSGLEGRGRVLGKSNTAATLCLSSGDSLHSLNWVWTIQSLQRWWYGPISRKSGQHTSNAVHLQYKLLFFLGADGGNADQYWRLQQQQSKRRRKAKQQSRPLRRKRRAQKKGRRNEATSSKPPHRSGLI